MKDNKVTILGLLFFLQLADALGKHPATFNDVYVNMVRAGEAGGILDDILSA